MSVLSDTSRSYYRWRCIPGEFLIMSKKGTRWARLGSALFALGFSSFVAAAQPKSELAPPPPLSPAEGAREARSLLSNLLSQKPNDNVTNSGVLKIRDAERRERTVPARFDITVQPGGWLNAYTAQATDGTPAQKLTVLHRDGAPDEYLYSVVAGTNATTRALKGNDLMLPFAGSDFWAVDLGLEFLRWPQQRVLKKQMRKNLFCDVLQSTNPNPKPGAYSRVLSWIAVNRPDEVVVVHAEAYDNQDRLLKEFDPKKVQKVNGAWQLEEMEIRNRQAGTRTRIEFNLDGQ